MYVPFVVSTKHGFLTTAQFGNIFWNSGHSSEEKGMRIEKQAGLENIMDSILMGITASSEAV